MRSLVVIAAIAVASVSAEFHCPTFAEFFSDLVFQTKPRFLVQCFDDSAFASGCLLGGNYRGMCTHRDTNVMKITIWRRLMLCGQSHDPSV